MHTGSGARKKFNCGNQLSILPANSWTKMRGNPSPYSLVSKVDAVDMGNGQGETSFNCLPGPVGCAKPRCGWGNLPAQSRACVQLEGWDPQTSKTLTFMGGRLFEGLTDATLCTARRPSPDSDPGFSSSAAKATWEARRPDNRLFVEAVLYRFRA